MAYEDMSFVYLVVIMRFKS